MSIEAMTIVLEARLPVLHKLFLAIVADQCNGQSLFQEDALEKARRLCALEDYDYQELMKVLYARRLIYPFTSATLGIKESDGYYQLNTYLLETNPVYKLEDVK